MTLNQLATDLVNTLKALAPIVMNALKSGQLFNPRCELTDADPDVLCEYDVAIPMSEGFSLTANIYRSKQAAEQNAPVPDRKSTRLNSSHSQQSRMPSSA